jgi:hypothetical protein
MLVRVFCLDLKNCRASDIQRGFDFYRQHNGWFPSSGDILTIIRRGIKPAFDGAVYRTLCRRDTPTPEETAYMREYEHYHVTGEMVIFEGDV